MSTLELCPMCDESTIGQNHACSYKDCPWNRLAELEAENARLRELLKKHATDYSMPPPLCMECGCSPADHREDCEVGQALAATEPTDEGGKP